MDALFHRAGRFPDRIAIVDSAGRHRYRDLDHAADRAAGALLAGGADLAGERVGYLVAPGFEHVATQWGIWRAGGIAVPIAINHPPPEISYLLDDARPAVLVATAGEPTDRLAPLAAARDLRCLTAAELLAGPAPPVRCDVALDRPAMMVYTSGTTGRPKGVVSSHAAIRAQVTTLVDAWGWTEKDWSLHVLPLHHIHGIINGLSCALWSGAAVEFMGAFDPVMAWERLASGEITFFTAVPTVYGRLIAAWTAAPSATQLQWSAGARRLRLMLSGSAALPVATLARWEELTGHRLLERYGMTEIGMALSNPLVGERRAGTVGRPLPGVSVRLIDETGAAVAAGAPGQILVRGPQLFTEYWNRAAETQAAFRDGWFETGDVAVLDGGYYRILGRQSVDIIKTAGYKVSALEIEEALREHPAVADCAVVGLPDPDLGERIVAAVVPAGAGPSDVEAIRLWLKTRVASYKVPKEVVVVGELPRNAMGKVTKPDVRRFFPDQ